MLGERGVSMKKIVITIARGFGSGGKQVAMMLSKKLGIPCYESQLLAMASDFSGINQELFYQVDEKIRGKHLVKHLKHAPNRDHIIEPSEKKFVSDDNLFNIQAKIIKELSQEEACIIIGKCANHILKDCDNVVSVYIEAPRKACVTNVISFLGVSEPEAHKMIEKTDKYRADYFKYYTGGEDWTNPTLYDMVLNSERIGQEQCVEVICAYLKIKFDIAE